MAVRLLLARALRLLPRCRPPRCHPRPDPRPDPRPAPPPQPWRPWLAWLPAARRLFLRGPAGGLAAVARRGRGGVCLALAMALGLVEPRLEEQRRAEAACRHIQVRRPLGGGLLRDPRAWAWACLPGAPRAPSVKGTGGGPCRGELLRHHP